MSSSAFYDPQNKQMTISVDSNDDWKWFTDEGVTLIHFENVEGIEFFWPDDKIWRAV